MTQTLSQHTSKETGSDERTVNNAAAAVAIVPFRSQKSFGGTEQPPGRQQIKRVYKCPCVTGSLFFSQPFKPSVS